MVTEKEIEKMGFRSSCMERDGRRPKFLECRRLVNIMIRSLVGEGRTYIGLSPWDSEVDCLGPTACVLIHCWDENE